MEILAQPVVDGGEELELQVRVQNFNEQDLQSPDLVLSYPKDSSVDSERVFLRRSLPDIASQNRVTEEFDLTLFGQEGDTRKIDATLEYRIEGSSSIFIKEIDHEVIIRSTPTQVIVSAPESIVRNQEITLDVDVSSNSNTFIGNTLLKVNYPRGFEFLRSSVEPNFNSNTWHFDTLGDEPETIQITGKLAALEGQGQSFHIEYGKQDQFNKNQFETVFNALTHTVDVQKSFIETGLFVNGSNSSSSNIRGGSDIDVTLSFENTLNQALQNVSIDVLLDGDLYDPDAVRVDRGFYNSGQRVISYDQTNNDQLLSLEPGQIGRLNFQLKAKELVTAEEILTNPAIDISVNVRGTEGGGNILRALGVSRHILQANSDISLVTKTLYHDGPFKNDGPVPPRVDTPTTYTLVLQALNSSNDVTDVRLRTTLPRFVRWLNSVSPSIERNNVSYDTTTRELIWTIGDLNAEVGVGTNPPDQLSLQVEVTPSINHLGDVVSLTGDLSLSGNDAFTGTTLNFNKRPLTTLLDNPNDPGGRGLVAR